MGHPMFIGGCDDFAWLDGTTFGSGIARALVMDAFAGGGGTMLPLDYSAMECRYEFSEIELRTAVGYLVANDFARIERGPWGYDGDWLLILTPGRLADDAHERAKQERKAAERAAKVALRGGQVNRRPIPDEVRDFVFDRDGDRCKECGATEDLALDHVYPWSLGGPDTADNLQVLCRPCNSRKGDRVAALSV